MIVDKIHETFSFNQRTWLEKSLSSYTQKGNEATNDFEKVFINY